MRLFFSFSASSYLSGNNELHPPTHESVRASPERHKVILSSDLAEGVGGVLMGAVDVLSGCNFPTLSNFCPSNDCQLMVYLLQMDASIAGFRIKNFLFRSNFVAEHGVATPPRPKMDLIRRGTTRSLPSK